MDQRTIRILFSLLCSAICGTKLTEEEQNNYTADLLPDLLQLSAKHDVAHLLALGLKQNKLLGQENAEVEIYIPRAMYRYEQIKCEYEKLCHVLEQAQIPFLPLKGSVIRKYYPEPWMRTSSDIDVLVHPKDSEKAKAILINECGYTYHNRHSHHDISLFTPNKVHVELHYNLNEDGLSNEAFGVLERVWDVSVVRDGFTFWYEMPDEMFYFYHIAHTAKHFANGGCGIRALIDLWVLDHMDKADLAKRNEWIAQGGLSAFTEASRQLIKIWFEHAEHDPISKQMEDYILCGGIHGSRSNLAKVKEARGKGKSKLFLKLAWLPKEKLEVLYPNLKAHPYLFLWYQMKRWLRIFRKSKRDKVRHLIRIRYNVSPEDADATKAMLKHLRLLNPYE